MRRDDLRRLHGTEDGRALPRDEPDQFRNPRRQIPAIVRAVIAIVWFGIQTYLASIVFRIFLVAVAPSLDRFDQNSILGLSSLGGSASSGSGRSRSSSSSTGWRPCADSRVWPVR